MTTQVASNSNLDAKLVNSVIQATMSVLQTMADTEAKFTEVEAVEDYSPSGDISAIISIFGDDGEGMFALSFPLGFAGLVVGRLLGTNPAGLSSEDRSDGVGEMVNMISGNAKALLTQGTETLYKMSTPTVILGRDHVITSRPRGIPYLTLKFEAEGYAFTLQVSFKKYAS